MAIALVVILCLTSFALAGPEPPESIDPAQGLVADVPETPDLDFAEPDPTEKVDISTDELEVSNGEGITPATAEEEPVAPNSDLEAGGSEEQPNTHGGILPDNRILAFYGFPGNPEMGILGEYGMDQLLEQLRKQAAEYEEADPQHPVVIAFEVIGSVAQNDPQADGSYLAEAPSDVLDDYAEFTQENGLLMIVDVQIGRRGVPNDVKGLQKWLKLPHVHLALDPEFSFTKDGEAPGMNIIGSVDATDVIWAQEYLIDLAASENLPPKILIVHQFTEKMITNKGRIEPMRGVQLVIDADGFGPTEEKKAVYDFIITTDQIEYAGIKLFYKRDVPIMSPEEVVQLNPAPLFIMYQ